MAMPPLLRSVLFRTHWILGITGGVVLAVVGATGAMLSFEEAIVDALNPQREVVPDGGPQMPDYLVARLREQQPDKVVAAVVWNGPTRAVTLRLDGRDAGSVHVNPYDGTVIPGDRGEDAMHLIEQVHRNLAAGPVGKQIVGASTVALLVMIVTGLVLRWPRRWLSPRAWLTMDWRLRGRGFLWHLHAVTATWVLPLYVVFVLTGLYWSYESYRAALFSLAGVTQPARGPGGGPGGRSGPDAPPPPLAVALDPSWGILRAMAPDTPRAMVNIPRAEGQPVEWRYLAPDAPHDRAFSSLKVDARDGSVLSHERFAESPTGRKAMALIFPLHSGGWLGWPGRLLMGIASLLMPLFAITGFWLWIWRRRQARALAAITQAAAARRGEPSSAIPEKAAREPA